jgi:TolB-like protein
MLALDTHGNSVLPKVRKTRALLALLALAAPRSVLRSQLIALLWSRREPEQARGSLRQALHELQTTLGPLAASLIVADRSQIGLRAEGLEVILGPPTGVRAVGRPLLDELTGIDPGLDAFLRAEQGSLMHRALAVTQETVPGPSDPGAKVSATEAALKLDARTGPEPCMSGLREPIPPYFATSQAQSGPDDARLPPPAATPHATRLRIGIATFRAGPSAAAAALAAGLEEEVVIALTPFRWISCVPVVSRQGVLEPSGMPFNVDCLLEGSVQENSGRLRATIRLLDLRAIGEVIWIARFDRELGDIFGLQEDIAAEIATQLEPRILLWEGRRALSNSGGPRASVRDLVLSAALRLFRLDRPSFDLAGTFLEQALRLDPSDPTTLTWLGQWHLFGIGQGWIEDIPAATNRVRELARAARMLAPDDSLALTLAGHVRAFIDNQPEDAMSLLDRAIKQNPNLALAWCRSGLVHTYTGQHEEALRRAEHARRIGAGHPFAFLFEGAIAIPHLMRRDYLAAVEAGERALALNPEFSSLYKTHLSALGHLGRLEEAALMRDRLLAIEPRFNIAQAVARSPIRNPEDRAHYAEGLRLAGLE